jgi:hypothetical protein
MVAENIVNGQRAHEEERWSICPFEVYEMYQVMCPERILAE